MKSAWEISGSSAWWASPNSGSSLFSTIIFRALRMLPVISSETWLLPALISADRMIDSGLFGQ